MKMRSVLLSTLTVLVSVAPSMCQAPAEAPVHEGNPVLFEFCTINDPAGAEVVVIAKSESYAQTNKNEVVKKPLTVVFGRNTPHEPTHFGVATVPFGSEVNQPAGLPKREFNIPIMSQGWALVHLGPSMDHKGGDAAVGPERATTATFDFAPIHIGDLEFRIRPLLDVEGERVQPDDKGERLIPWYPMFRGRWINAMARSTTLFVRMEGGDGAVEVVLVNSSCLIRLETTNGEPVDVRPNQFVRIDRDTKQAVAEDLVEGSELKTRCTRARQIAGDIIPSEPTDPEPTP